MSEQTEGGVSHSNSRSLLFGVVGILGVGAGIGFVMLVTNHLEKGFEKDREAQTAAMKAASDKTNERIGQLEKAMADLKALTQKLEADLKLTSDNAETFTKAHNQITDMGFAKVNKRIDDIRNGIPDIIETIAETFRKEDSQLEAKINATLEGAVAGAADATGKYVRNENSKLEARINARLDALEKRIR